jgi:hypothetical protein
MLIFRKYVAKKENTLNRKIVSLIAIVAVAVASPAAIAIAQAPAASARTQVPARSTAGPTVAASVVGIKANSTSTPKAVAADNNLGAGRNVALMVVGGAALIIGAIIGGTAGVLIAVGGAAVGLYGLYYFVQ